MFSPGVWGPIVGHVVVGEAPEKIGVAPRGAVGLSADVAERTWRAMIAAFIDQEIAEIRGRRRET